jgi:hypothetical protein
MKNKLKNPLVVLALGLIIIASGSAGAARAAIVLQSASERVNFSTATISVEIQEQTEDGFETVEKELAFPEVAKDDKFKIGKEYEEIVRVVNNSNEETGYSEYVRVVVRKNWFKDGKSTNLDPELITLKVADGWYLNPDESTSEQEVYYMTTPLACGNAAEFLKSIKIEDKLVTYVETKPYVEDGTEIAGTIVNEYLYNGQSFQIEIQADAVQTHNGADAIYAAWGIRATCDTEDDGNIVTIGDKATN